MGWELCDWCGTSQFIDDDFSPDSGSEHEPEQPTIYVAKLYVKDGAYSLDDIEYVGFSHDKAVQILQDRMKQYTDLHYGRRKYIGYISEWKNGFNETSDEKVEYNG